MSLADEPPEHRQQVVDEIVQVDRRRLQQLPAAEREQLLRQLGGALGGLLDLAPTCACRGSPASSADSQSA